MITNAELARAAFERWATSRGRDVSAWLELFADDIVIIQAAGGREPAGFTRSLDRKAGLMSQFDFLAREAEMVDFVVDHIVEADDKVLALTRSIWRRRHTGRVLRLRVANVFWFRAGRVVRYESFYDTAAYLEWVAPAPRRGDRLRERPDRPRQA